MNRYLVLVYRLIIVVLTIIPFTSQILLAQNESTNISYEDAYRVLLEVDANPKYKGLIFYDSYEKGNCNYHFSPDNSPKQRGLPMKEYIKKCLHPVYPEDAPCYSSVKECREEFENAYEFVYNMNHHDTGPFSVVEFKERIEMDEKYENYGTSYYWCQPDSIFIRTRLFNKDSFFTTGNLPSIKALFSTKDKINTFVDSISNMIEFSRSFLQCSLDSTAMANYKDEGLSYRDFLIKKCDEDNELQDRISSKWRLTFAALTFVKELSDLQKKQIFCGQYNNMITNLKKERKEKYNNLQAYVKDLWTDYSYVKDTPILEGYEIPDGKVYIKQALKGLSVDSLYSLYRIYRKGSEDIEENSVDFFRKIESHKRLYESFMKKEYSSKWLYKIYGIDISVAISNSIYDKEKFAKYILNNPSVLVSKGKMDISERDYCIKYLEEFVAKIDSCDQLYNSFSDYVTEWLKNGNNNEFLSQLKENWDLDLNGQLNTRSLLDAFYNKKNQGVEHLEYKGSFDKNVIYSGKNEMIVINGNGGSRRYFRLKDGRWARYFRTNIANDEFLEDLSKLRPFIIVTSDPYFAIEVYNKSINHDMLPYLGDERTTAYGRRVVDIDNRIELPIDECGWYYKKESLVKRDLKAEDQMETLERVLGRGERCLSPDGKRCRTGKGGSVIYKDPEVVDFGPNTDINELVLAVGIDYKNADGTKKYIDTMPSEDYIKFINVLKPKLVAEFLRRSNASDVRDRKSELRNYTAAYGAAQARAFLNNNKQPFKGMTLRFFRNEFGDSCSVLREDSNGNVIFKYDGGFFKDHYYYFRHGVLTHWTYSN